MLARFRLEHGGSVVTVQPEAASLAELLLLLILGQYLLTRAAQEAGAATVAAIVPVSASSYATDPRVSALPSARL